MEAAFIYLYLLCFEALRDCGCVFSVTMPASGTWIAKIVQAERKAKRSLGFAEAQPIFAAKPQQYNPSFSFSVPLAFHPILTRRRKCRGKLYSDTPSFLSYGWKMDSDASCLCSPGIRIGGLDSRTEKLFKISCHPEKAGFSGAGFRFLFARRGLFRV